MAAFSKSWHPIQERPALPAIARKRVCCSMSLFLALRAFHFVQDFVALVDPRSNLLLARKAHCVVEIADDAPIFEVQLRCEIELGRHSVKTSSCASSSDERLDSQATRVLLLAASSSLLSASAAQLTLATLAPPGERAWTSARWRRSTG